MNDVLLFAVGSVIFLFTSLVTLRFMEQRFTELAAASTEATDTSSAPNEQRRNTNA